MGDDRKILGMSAETCILLGAVALVIVFIIFAGVAGGGQFLEEIADHEVARGLITFVVSVGTIGIALLVTLAALLGGGTSATESGERFNRAKDVLTLLIGILGTVVGFYFGTTIKEPSNGPPRPAIVNFELKSESDRPPIPVEPPPSE